MDKLFTLGVLLKGIDELTAPLRAAAKSLEGLDKVAENSRHLEQLGKSMKSLGQDMAIQGAVVAGSMLAPIKAFSDLEDATTRARVAYMTAGGTDPLFTKIAAQAVELGNKLPGTTADFMEMAAALREAGISSQGVLAGAFKATADFRALMGDLGPKEAAQMMATFRTSLGVMEKDFVRFVDDVQRAHFAFGLDPQAFAYTLQYAGPLARQIGLQGIEGAEQILSLSGMMAQAGIKGEVLGTSLRGVIERLAQIDQVVAHSKTIGPILERVGVHLRFFEHGRFVGMDRFIGQLEQLKRLAPQERLLVIKELFGSESAATMATLIDRGVKGYRDALVVMQHQASLQQRVGAVLGTLRSVWDAATGTFTNTLAALGAAMGPDLKALAETLNSVSESLGSLITRHQTLARVLGLTALGLGAFGAIVGTTIIALGSLLQWTFWAIKGLSYLPAVLRSILFVGRAVWALLVGVGEAIAALVSAVGLPVVLLVAATAAAVAAIYYYWEPIKAFFARLWTGVQLIFQDAADWLANLNLFDAGANIIRSVWEGMKSLAHKPIEIIREIAAAIRDHLPFSPAKVGPLRDLQRVRIIQTIAGTMRAGPMVDAMRIAASATIVAATIPALSAGAQTRGPAERPPIVARGPVTLHAPITVHVQGDATPQSRAEFERRLREHAAMIAELVRRELGNDRMGY